MLNWIAVLAFTAVTALAAGRLFAMWHETRKLPELLIATLILGVGTLGVGGGFLVRALVPAEWQGLASFVPSVGVCAGMVALCIFTWTVYRPESRVAAAAAILMSVALAGLLAPSILAGNARAMEGSNLMAAVSSVLYVGAMLWSAAEALLYWVPMRRRLKLGLADPVVANRVLLWGIATGTAGVGIAIGALARFIGGITDADGSWVIVSYALHGSVSAIGFWLAFKPPAAYVRWVSGSAKRA